ncbi:16S rRNA (guanine(966)-N(2))-methyltransferase RsmD [Jatrophihabitans endophyticus]|uniref:16S rRNA (guanine(966)-N(2))-methyltransferase RsmD n=1 Tax=Jatrophihabitans endophyticus TaxID=1206085 RepID=UPI0019FF2B39|nr:16S rRNA (guanine(966)-N(2))-methyltransferase RsmD [Jatrophihabitans endophyticus]MBE7188767.1 16S rRNA (guanine(966)-N(2))-methyltransferase RsmD [Jatrophihabitans endophyticus]
MRIVAGLAKGRRLSSPAAGTRPTSDRAREAMFNTLASTIRLDGARVLDLFAGTGAVGLEALSRGAAEAVFVEKNRAALDVLRRNVDAVGLPGAVIDPRHVSLVLGGGTDAPFDLVFADPPYADSDASVEQLLLALCVEGWLAPDGVVVLERSARTPVGDPVASLTPVAEKRYGDSLLWYGRRR